MSEEEKKAIDDLKRLRKGIEILNQITPEKDDVDIKAINIILNLTEKQQKELENYKNFKKDIVSKIMFWDKEELPDNERIISMLDTLMEEVSRLEDIEAKRDKFWQDKIRETIEHYNNELEHIKNGEEFENEKPMYYWGKAALEGLLEEN